MYYRLPESRYLPVPNTGVKWVTDALVRAGVRCEPVEENTPLSNSTSGREPFTFTFVRHPLDWYVSRWRCRSHRQRIADGTNLELLDAKSDREAEDFVAWFDRVIEEIVFSRNPGEHLFSEVTKRADFVGRTERLRGDLERAVFEGDESFDVRVFRELPPANVSTWPRPEIPNRVLARLAMYEHETFAALDYEVKQAECLRRAA